VSGTWSHTHPDAAGASTRGVVTATAALPVRWTAAWGWAAQKMFALSQSSA
jgi:hypothetical protein